MFKVRKGKFIVLTSMLLVLSLSMAGCNQKKDSGATSSAESSQASSQSSSKISASTTPSTTDSTSKAKVENSAFQKAETDLLNALSPLPKKDTGVKLAAIESTLANPFWVTMKSGYEDTAKEYGVSIDVMATETETDVNGQLEMLKTLLVKDYAGIAVSPLTESNLISGIAEANGKKVSVVAVGNGVDEAALKEAKGSIDAFITTNFEEQGVLSGEYIAEKIGNKGKVAVIEGMPGGTQSEARKKGALKAFNDAGLEVLPVQTGNWDRQKAYDIVSALIDANPDLKGIACANDVMALGAVEALKAKGKKQDVIVVGIDFTDEAKESIEKGELDASVAMSPYLFGKAGVIASLKAVQGEKMPEPVVWTPTILVDQENVASMEGWK